MAATVFHIRLRLQARGGNQFYRDRSDRPAATFCGAACTEYDQGWADRKRAQDWTQATTGRRFVVCAACQAAVAAAEGGR